MKRLFKSVALLLIVAALLGTCACSIPGGPLAARCETVKNSDFFANFYSDPDKYEYLMKGFNRTREQLESEFLHNYDWWFGLRLGITLENGNDFDVTVLGLDVKKNGENSNIISILPRDTVTLAANTSERKTVWFDMFADGGENSNEEVLELVKDMGLRLICVRADSGIESLSDAPEEILIYEKVK